MIRLNFFNTLFILISVALKAQVPVMNPITGPANVCSVPSSGYSFTASATNSPNSYQWSVLNPSTGIVIANANNSVTGISFPNTNLNYTLMCTATNSAGTSAPVVYIVKVYETPSVTFSGAQSYCQGSSTNLSASPTILSASSTLFYNWSPSTGLNTTTGPSVTASPNTTTTYSVLLTMATCTNMAYVTITVNPLPSFTPVISNTLFCKNDPQTLSINGNATSYSINTSTIGTQSTLNYSVSGGVLITVFGTNSAGCQSAASITFSVGNCSVGLKEKEIKSLSDLFIFPNPNSGSFSVKKSNPNESLIIYNQWGVIVREYSFQDSDEITVTNLRPGVYFVSNGKQQLKVVVYN